MKRRLQKMGSGWVLPLMAEELIALGVNAGDGAVLVRAQDGDQPRLITRRVLTFSEAMEATLDCHGAALARLVAMDAGGQNA